MAEHDLPTALARDVRTRIHAVLENSDKAVYLGFRVTTDLDPRDPVNLGHVTALLRASGDLVDIRGVVAVHVEVELPRVRAARFRLHCGGAGTEPVLTDPVSTGPTGQGGAGLPHPADAGTPAHVRGAGAEGAGLSRGVQREPGGRPARR